MSTAVGLVRSCLGLLVFGWPVLGRAAEIELNASALSGDYEDAGTVVEPGDEPAGFEPSFAALLRLEFDPKLAAVRHAETSRVDLQQGVGTLVIKIHDTDDAVIWSGRWSEGSGYVQRGRSVVLRIRPASPDAEEVILTFEPVAENRLVQLTVQRVRSTVFGPGVVWRRVYLFARLP